MKIGIVLACVVGGLLALVGMIMAIAVGHSLWQSAVEDMEQETWEEYP